MNSAVREAHTVKGLAGNIGATLLAEHAAQVEAMLNRGETEGLGTALDAMGAELVSLLARITAAMGEEPQQTLSSATSSVDRELLADDLRRLAGLLADDDSDAGELADGLADRLGAVGQSAAAQALLKRVGDFEFESALERVREIAHALEIAL